MMLHFLSYILLRIATLPFAFLPYKAIHFCGRVLGTILYLGSSKFRKRSLSNLSLASQLHLSEEEIKTIAKQSLQNLGITCLEYAKLGKEKEIHKIATCVNPQPALRILEEGKGIVFFCGHQSNWEILFLEGTSRMPGVAVGRPIRNQFLYKWILSIREKYKGTIIARNHAAKEGLRALRQGKFLGIVGDQAMPESPFSSLFLGRLAWTSPLPAMLSYKTGAPLLVATTKRKDAHYFIHYSDPIFPNKEAPIEQEVDRMMKKALSLLEASIIESPGEWLWSHNRWKQQTLEKIRRPFREDCFAILISPESFENVCESLPTWEILYPREFITVFIPKKYKGSSFPERWEKIYYEKEEELFVRDFRFKLVFNFTQNTKLSSHFTSLSALRVFSLKDLEKHAPSSSLSETLKKVILCP